MAVVTINAHETCAITTGQYHGDGSERDRETPPGGSENSIRHPTRRPAPGWRTPGCSRRRNRLSELNPANQSRPHLLTTSFDGRLRGGLKRGAAPCPFVNITAPPQPHRLLPEAWRRREGLAIPGRAAERGLTRIRRVAAAGTGFPRRLLVPGRCSTGAPRLPGVVITPPHFAAQANALGQMRGARFATDGCGEINSMPVPFSTSLVKRNTPRADRRRACDEVFAGAPPRKASSPSSETPSSNGVSAIPVQRRCSTPVPCGCSMSREHQLWQLMSSPSLWPPQMAGARPTMRWRASSGTTCRLTEQTR